MRRALMLGSSFVLRRAPRPSTTRMAGSYRAVRVVLMGLFGVGVSLRHGREPHPGAAARGGVRHAGERARGAGRVDAAVRSLLHRRSLALRVMGLDRRPGFAVYHRVLSRGAGPGAGPPAPSRTGCCYCSSPSWPQRGRLWLALDDTIEGRWGAKNQGAGDLPRSGPLQPRLFCQASSLRWRPVR